MNNAGAKPAMLLRHVKADDAFRVLTVAILSLAAIVVLLPAYAPLQDYLEWTFHGALGREMLLSGELPGRDLFFRSYPIPNSFIQILLIALNFVVSPSWAQRIVLVIYILLLAVLIRSMRRSGQEPNSFIVIAVSILLGSQFFNGYLNNLFGNTFLLIYVANSLRRPASLLETFLFSLLIFNAHATSFVVFCMWVGMRAIWPLPLDFNRIKGALPVIPAGLMFVWYYLAKDTQYQDIGLQISSIPEIIFYKAYTVGKLGPFHNFFGDEHGYMEAYPSIFWLGVAANAVFAVIMAALVFRFFFAGDRHRLRDPAWACIAILLIAYPFMPRSVAGVVNIGERFFTIAMLLLLVYAARYPSTLIDRIGAALASLLIGSLLLLSELSFNHTTGNVKSIANDIPSGFDGRLARLYWHRPFLYEGRIEDMRKLREGGLDAVDALYFQSSIIGSETLPGSGEIAD
jgi:hypothetical protein